jgi:hypothetical protein
MENTMNVLNLVKKKIQRTMAQEAAKRAVLRYRGISYVKAA